MYISSMTEVEELTKKLAALPIEEDDEDMGDVEDVYLGELKAGLQKAEEIKKAFVERNKLAQGPGRRPNTEDKYTLTLFDKKGNEISQTSHARVEEMAAILGISLQRTYSYTSGRNTSSRFKITKQPQKPKQPKPKQPKQPAS